MLVYKKESPEAIRSQADFILTCQTITSDIIALPNCPWANNNDPIKYWISNGQHHLGKIQMDIIKFFHRNYFQYGRPVYLKARNIAARMGLTLNAVVKAISKLVDRGVLIRMHFMMDSNNRSMILPGTKEFNEFRRENKNPEVCIPPSTHMFCKLPKPLQESKAVYSILLYFKQVYLNLKVSLQTLVDDLKTTFFYEEGMKQQPLFQAITSSEIKTPLINKPSLLQSLKNKINKPPAQKPKPPAPSIERLKDILKKHDYDMTKMPTVDQNDLAAIIDHRMMIDIRKEFMRGLQVPSAIVVNRAKKLLRMVCWLFVHNLDLDIESTNAVLERWNSLALGHPKIQRHPKTKPGTSKFTSISIIVTFQKHQRGLSTIYRAIDRLFHNGWEQRHAFFMQKRISFEEAILNPFDKELWKTMLDGDDHDWNVYCRNDGYKVRVNVEEVAKAKEMFLDLVYGEKHRTSGKKYLEMNNKGFSSWVNRLIASNKYHDRETGGRDLIFPKDNATPSVLFEYFYWYAEFRPMGNIDINHLTSKECWGQFIGYMQREYTANFWKRGKNIVEE